MKVAYVLYWLDGPESGVFRKISNQIRFWVAAGHDVTLVLAGPDEKETAYREAFVRTGAKFQYLRIRNGFERWFRWRNLKGVLRKLSPTVVYHRFDLATPGLISSAQRGKWVVEINTNDVVEYGLHPGLRNSYNNFTRKRLFAKAGAGVFVTDELANHGSFSAFTTQRRVISNGVDLANTPSAPPLDTNAPVEILFMGSDGHSWHGVDKLTQLAEARPDWRIHAVGVSRKMFPNGIPQNINAPGKLGRRDYEPLVFNSVVGIGTLALHRKGMEEACALKVREYLAYGLPVILGCKDTDVRDGAPYALRIPNTEDNVTQNLGAIQDFVEKWRGRRVPRSAVSHMDWAEKEKQRLDVMAQVSRG